MNEFLARKIELEEERARAEAEAEQYLRQGRAFCVYHDNF